MGKNFTLKKKNILNDKGSRVLYSEKKFCWLNCQRLNNRHKVFDIEKFPNLLYSILQLYRVLRL